MYARTQFKENVGRKIEGVQAIDPSDSSELFRFVMKLPFPFAKREYIYRRWERIEPSPNGSGSRSVLTHAPHYAPHPLYSPSSSILRGIGRSA